MRITDKIEFWLDEGYRNLNKHIWTKKNVLIQRELDKKKKKTAAKSDIEDYEQEKKRAWAEEIGDLKSILGEKEEGEHSEKDLSKYLKKMKGKNPKEIVKGLKKTFGLSQDDAERAIELVE